MSQTLTHPAGSRLPWAVLFFTWLIAGLWGLVLVCQQLFAIAADVYVLNGSDQPVTVANSGKLLATLQPAESTLIRLAKAGSSLEIKGEGSTELLGPVESGVSILNIGDNYQVTHDWASYSSMPSTSFHVELDYHQEGLHRITDYAVLPWLVYGFDSSPPGSVPESSSASRLDLIAKSQPERRVVDVVERRQLLNSELMKEFRLGRCADSSGGATDNLVPGP